MRATSASFHNANITTGLTFKAEQPSARGGTANDNDSETSNDVDRYVKIKLSNNAELKDFTYEIPVVKGVSKKERLGVEDRIKAKSITTQILKNKNIIK